MTVVYWLRRAGSGVALDAALLRLPYFGALDADVRDQPALRTLSTLLAGGLPLVNALEVGRELDRQPRDGASPWPARSSRIREGASLTTALESTGMLEACALEMVKVGEQTGALGDMLTAVAEFYDEELDTRIATVLSLVEPVLLVLMAVIVAVMLLAFYLPMFQAISAVQGRR